MAKYRPNVAILVTDGHGRVLLCYRTSERDARAQTVQGGIDPGETAEEAAVRELYEEIGLKPTDYRFLGVSEAKYRYEWTSEFLATLKEQIYIGQEQQFFLIEVDPKVEFDLDTHAREFDRVRWGTPEELVAEAWEKKQPGLAGALREFGLLPGHA